MEVYINLCKDDIKKALEYLRDSFDIFSGATNEQIAVITAWAKGSPFNYCVVKDTGDPTYPFGTCGYTRLPDYYLVHYGKVKVPEPVCWNL